MTGNAGYNHKLFWPLTLIFGGVLVMMMNMGVIPSHLWKLWPVVLVVLGLIGLAGTDIGGSTTRKSSARKKSSRRR